MELDRFPQRAARVLSRETPDGVVLLDVDGGEYFAMNGVGARIWELCDGTRTVDDIVRAICDEYEAPVTVVRRDVAELLAELTTQELVRAP